MRKKKFSTLSVMCLPMLACGGGGAANNKITVVDANGSGHVFNDAGSGSAAPCTATADYGTVMVGSAQDELKFTAAEVGSGFPNEEFDGALNSDMTPDLIVLQLYSGYGGFGSGAVRPGTYTLSGDELAYATCGICAEIQTNVNFNAQPPTSADTYFATGGTIALTATGSGSANVGTLTGTFTNVTFTHVNIGSAGTTAVGDCNAKIDSLAFSGVLAPADGSGAFTGDSAKLRLSLLQHRWR